MYVHPFFVFATLDPAPVNIRALRLRLLFFPQAAPAPDFSKSAAPATTSAQLPAWALWLFQFPCTFFRSWYWSHIIFAASATLFFYWSSSGSWYFFQAAPAAMVQKHAAFFRLRLWLQALIKCSIFFFCLHWPPADFNYFGVQREVVQFIKQ